MKITCITPQGHRTTCDRGALLTPALREASRTEANQWIKRLRLVRYGGATMRERFTYRGESLWWFTELYLHKMRRLDAAVDTLLALDAARQGGAAAFVVETVDSSSREAALAFGRASGVRVDLAGDRQPARGHGWASRLVGLTALLSRLRPTRAIRPARRPRVAAFVHTAFWRAADPQQETYIGPVLDALITESSRDEVFFVGLGPRRNFRARRWWDSVAPGADERVPVAAIEQFAPPRAIRESSRLWRQRHRLAAAVIEGEDIRAAAVVRGCDLWPVLRHELRGAALIQWPWSARTMDEAGAAIDALGPGAVVTYAEAGGWGRALALEARRRGVPSVGVQHGFIYRHWLNYLHEADEMAPTGTDGGFPRPDRTLLYDRYAAEHLAAAGRFPASSLTVTGSARLERLIGRLEALRPAREEIRRRHGVSGAERLAVVAAKFTEIQPHLPALIGAASRMADLRLVIKAHPAETADVYAAAVGGARNAEVAPPSTDLAELLAAADVVVTMNSTVAIDGLVLGLPAVVVGLPNNLSPFVEAGVMLGADGPAAIQQTLEAVLYDRQVRQSLGERAGAFAARYRLAPEPGAAVRAAREILALDRNHP